MSFWWILLVSVAVSCSTVKGMIEDYDKKWIETMGNMTSPPSGDVSAQALSCRGIQFDTPDGQCLLGAKPEATSVHLLTPADIGIVAAIGDSITAGFGARASNIFDSPTKESRGVSWSIGGDSGNYQECTTIPNILRAFNPDVYGASLGSGDENSGGSNLNRAVSGAESTDIYEQALRLIDMIQALSEEEQKKWKLVTLWIGGNDLCRHCSSSDGDMYNGAGYVGRIKETLLLLKENLPRTLVNVPQALDVTKIAETTGLICGIVHWFACDCANSGGTSARAKEYQEALTVLDDDPELQSDEFAVVVQPFFTGVDLPREGNDPDMSFFAPDCFHMSTKGHRAIAAALWNNMVTPIGEKETNWEPYNPVLECPDPAHPYFYTSKTQSLLEEDGRFNAQSAPEPDDQSDIQNSADDQSSSDDGKLSTGQLIGIVFGSAVALVAVMVVVIGVAMWVSKHRRADSDNESVVLITKQ